MRKISDKKIISSCFTIVLGIVLLMSIGLQVKAQRQKKIGAPGYRFYDQSLPDLYVGDVLPDFKIPKIINYKKTSAQSADFKDQLLIIDFWATSCGSCISAMPHMEALQKEFGEKIKILPVTMQPEAYIKAFWKKNRYTKSLGLPSVVEDSAFRSYFKHLSIPHEVWVYKGKVIGITYAAHVTAENIQKVLNGEKVNWPLKYDFYKPFDATQPIFQKDSTQIAENGVITYSGISDFKPGFADESQLATGIVRDSIKKSIRVFALNVPVSGLYNMFFLKIRELDKSFSASSLGMNNSIIWEVADRSNYRLPKKGNNIDWLITRSLCFETVYEDKGQSDLEVYQSAVKDLDKLLGLNVRWEKRKETVYVLKDKPGAVFAQQSCSEEMKPGIHLYDIPYVWNLNEDNPYFVDATVNAKKEMDIAIDTADIDPKNFESLKDKLTKHGLELTREEQLVDKMVLAEVDGGMFFDAEMEQAAKAKRAIQKGMGNPTPEEGKAFLAANAKKTGVVTLPSGLQYKVLKTGDGAKPGLADNVTAHYTGTLVNGKIFDSSYEQGRAMRFDINDVIKGWQEILPMMAVGAKWEIYIPAELAYGKGTNYGAVPANSVLVFQIELLRVEKSKL